MFYLELFFKDIRRTSHINEYTFSKIFLYVKFLFKDIVRDYSYRVKENKPGHCLQSFP